MCEGKKKLTLAQKQELFDSIRTKSEIPHKFAYLDKGAIAWNAVSEDSTYDLGKRELSTLKSVVQLVRAQIKNEPYNVIHIGSGNGVEIPTIIDALGVQRITNYALVDISLGLLEMAKSNGEKHAKNLKILPFVCDVTKPGISEISAKLRRNGSNKNLNLLIANGAILSNSSVLPIIKESMTQKDKLLIILELYSAKREKEILEEYKLPSIINLFSESLSTIGIYNPTPEQFEFVYDRKNSMMEVFFNNEKWLESHSTHSFQQETPVPKKIRVFRSLRPTAPKLKRLLTDTGFKILFFHYFNEEKCCGVLCGI